MLQQHRLIAGRRCGARGTLPPRAASVHSATAAAARRCPLRGSSAIVCAAAAAAAAAPAGGAAQHQGLPLCSQLRRQRLARRLCRARTRAAGAADEASTTASSTTTAAVVEYVLLLRLRPDAPADAVQDLLDAAWSLQFMAPAIMCAAVGPVASWTAAAAGAAPSGSSGGGDGDSGGGNGDVPPRFTHAVHYRLAQRAALAALLRHPLLAALLRDTAAPLLAVDAEGTGAPGGGGSGGGAGPAVAQLAFEGALPRDIEGLFRRGAEFGEGADALVVFDSSHSGGAPAQGPGGADDFARRLVEFARGSSPAGGAVQASAGPLLLGLEPAPLLPGAAGAGSSSSSSSGGGGGGGGNASGADGPTTGAASPPLSAHNSGYALMARFPTAAAAAAFLAAPACVAARAGDPRLPLRAVAEAVIVVEPGEEGASRKQAL